jgi:hypothetical protein
VGFNWRCGNVLVGWLRFVVSLFGRYPQIGFGALRFSVRLAGLRPSRAVQSLNAIGRTVLAALGFCRWLLVFVGWLAVLVILFFQVVRVLKGTP